LAGGTETVLHPPPPEPAGALDALPAALLVVRLELLELLELPHPARASATPARTAHLRTGGKESTPVAIIRSGRMPLSPLLAKYDNVLVDLDGCVWVGGHVTPRAPEAIAALRAAGKALAFVTNDSRRSPEDYVRKLWSLGMRASLEEVVTAGAAIQYLLADRGTGVSTYVIGSRAVFRHVTDSGQRIVNGTDRESEAELVIVAGHDGFDYDELQTATRAVLAGAEMIAADRDRTFPTDDGISPGTGAIVAALEFATERSARLVGKPEPALFQTALDRLGPGRTLVIGDRLDADLAGAAAAGLDAAIVLTGVTSEDEARAAQDPAPVAIAADLHSLVVAR
jgi:glycerol 3-phosphatase-2